MFYKGLEQAQAKILRAVDRSVFNRLCQKQGNDRKIKNFEAKVFRALAKQWTDIPIEFSDPGQFDSNQLKELGQGLEANSFLAQLKINLQRKIINQIKRSYIECQKSGKLLKLKFISLNAYLLYQKSLADRDVFERAYQIGKELKALGGADFIVLQEVFPKDTNRIVQGQFTWPQSTDWPMSDLKLIERELQRDSQDYHSFVTERKQINGSWRPISKIFDELLLGRPVSDLFLSEENNFLNPGPSGLALTARKKLSVLDLASGKRESKDLSFKGKYFRPNLAVHYNKLIPLSRGELIGVYHLDDWGGIELSTSHFTTDQFNGVHRLYQAQNYQSHWEERNFNSIAYIESELTKYIGEICTYHQREVLSSGFYSQVCLSDGSELASLVQLKNQLNPKSELRAEMENTLGYFSYLKEGSSRANLISVFGGDFNFSPTMREAVQTRWDDLAYQALGAQSIFYWDHDLLLNERYQATFDGINNEIVKRNETSLAGQLSRIIEQVGGSLPKEVKDSLSSLLGDETPSESEQQRKIDHFILRDTGAPVLWYLSKNQRIFDGENGPILSDHYGLELEITLWKPATR